MPSLVSMRIIFSRQRRREPPMPYYSHTGENMNAVSCLPKILEVIQYSLFPVHSEETRFEKTIRPPRSTRKWEKFYRHHHKERWRSERHGMAGDGYRTRLTSYSFHSVMKKNCVNGSIKRPAPN